jgi:hypothetical protein
MTSGDTQMTFFGNGGFALQRNYRHFDGNTLKRGARLRRGDLIGLGFLRKSGEKKEVADLRSS